VSSGTHNETLAIAGRPRVVRVHVPSGYDGKQPVPLVVNMHGSGSTAAGQEAFSGMDATADKEGFIVVYPQANIPQGSGYDWNVPGVPLIGGTPVPADAADDIAFIKAVVANTQASYCIDKNRVYATGMSGGGRMASQLACDASDVFAAVAPVAGLRFPSPCPATRAVPVIAFHGTADPVDPFNGNGQPYWTYSVPEAASRWATHNGCDATAQTSTPAPTVMLSTYTGCKDGAAVELYAIGGEGHEWPGGPALPKAETRELGPQSDAVSANELMWSFFSQHQL
jgi:polyhydroxybutyrate depolymerase